MSYLNVDSRQPAAVAGRSKWLPFNNGHEFYTVLVTSAALAIGIAAYCNETRAPVDHEGPQRPGIAPPTNVPPLPPIRIVVQPLPAQVHATNPPLTPDQALEEGRALANGEDSDTKNIRQALVDLRFAKGAHIAGAATQIGIIFQNGDHVRQSYNVANQNFMFDGNLGDVTAQYFFGQNLVLGLGYGGRSFLANGCLWMGKAILRGYVGDRTLYTAQCGAVTIPPDFTFVNADQHVDPSP